MLVTTFEKTCRSPEAESFQRMHFPVDARTIWLSDDLQSSTCLFCKLPIRRYYLRDDMGETLPIWTAWRTEQYIIEENLL